MPFETKVFYAGVHQDLTDVISVTEMTLPEKLPIDAAVTGFDP